MGLRPARALSASGGKVTNLSSPLPVTCGHAALLSRTTGFAGLRETQNVGASLCPMVMIRPLLPACAQERMCMTQIREVGRIFFVEKPKPSLEKLKVLLAMGRKSS